MLSLFYATVNKTLCYRFSDFAWVSKNYSAVCHSSRLVLPTALPDEMTRSPEDPYVVLYTREIW